MNGQAPLHSLRRCCRRRRRHHHCRGDRIAAIMTLAILLKQNPDWQKIVLVASTNYYESVFMLIGFFSEIKFGHCREGCQVVKVAAKTRIDSSWIVFISWLECQAQLRHCCISTLTLENSWLALLPNNPLVHSKHRRRTTITTVILFRPISSFGILSEDTCFVLWQLLFATAYERVGLREKVLILLFDGNLWRLVLYGNQ